MHIKKPIYSPNTRNLATPTSPLVVKNTNFKPATVSRQRSRKTVTPSNLSGMQDDDQSSNRQIQKNSNARIVKGLTSKFNQTVRNITIKDQKLQKPQRTLNRDSMPNRT